MPLPAAATPVSFILTADRAKTMPFYDDILGLKLIAEEDFGVVFDLGGGATLASLTSRTTRRGRTPYSAGRCRTFARRWRSCVQRA